MHFIQEMKEHPLGSEPCDKVYRMEESLQVESSGMKEKEGKKFYSLQMNSLRGKYLHKKAVQPTAFQINIRMCEL